MGRDIGETALADRHQSALVDEYTPSSGVPRVRGVTDPELPTRVSKFGIFDDAVGVARHVVSQRPGPGVPEHGRRIPATPPTNDGKRRLREAKERGERLDESYMPTVWLSTRRTKDSVLVSVKDNGDGIPDDVADKIFNPFFTTKPTDRGTGLGLAISNDIVRQHGGTIEVVSTPGTSTEMIVELPLEVPDSVGEPEPADV